MKQTALEWLYEEFTKTNYLTEDEFYMIFNQAKAMEKEQIINAREDGHLSTYAEYGETPKCYLDGWHEQYYNETFKQQEQ